MVIRRAWVPVVVAALSLGFAACRKETPIERAERLCLAQERAKIDSTASPERRNLSELGAGVICSAGPMLCSLDPNSRECLKFLDKYK